MKKRLEELDSLIEVLSSQQDDLRICNSFDILNVSGLMHKLFDEGYRRTGLKRTQIQILGFILANGGATTLSELRNYVYRSDNALSKSLDSLDRLGMTKSTQSKTDRRRRRTAITKNGLDVMKEILPIRNSLFTEATNSLTREEGERLRSILQTLSDHLALITSKKRDKKKKKLYF